jgi:uncharacterized protein
VKAPLNQAAGATTLSPSSAGVPQLATVGQAEAQSIRSISVSGEGTAIAVPNIAKVDLGVDVTNRTLTAARDEAANKMNSIVQKLKDFGIADKDIQTIVYSVYPQQDYNNSSVALIGFEVTQVDEVTIRDLSKVGNIVDAVVDLGANNISGINFTVEDMTPMQAQAREKAMADAKSKADQLAKLAGVTLGPVFSVSESTGFFPIPFTQGGTAAKSAAPAGGMAPNAAAPAMGAPAVGAQSNSGQSVAAPSSLVPAPIQGGQLEVQSDVMVVYSIQ